MAEYVEKMKEAFQKIFREPLNIWEETVIDNIPEEFERYFEHIAESALMISTIIELCQKRMTEELVIQEVEEFREWLTGHSPQHTVRLQILTHFVNVATLLIVKTGKEML